jgi:hypothetical protein
MARIINGEILQNNDPRVLAYDTAQRRSQIYAKYKFPFLLVVVFSIVITFSSSKDAALRSGKIPADERSWNEHWHWIRDWDTFTRDMTSHEPFWVRLKRGFSTVLFGGVGEYATVSDAAADIKSDGGGRGVPTPESSASDVNDKKAWAVTRCSSTRYAVTAYYCGLDIANNANHNAEMQDKIKLSLSSRHGVQSLNNYLQRWYDNTSFRKKNKDSSVRVIRLGLGQHERSTPPLEHVWSIICLPNGAFEWYQSYISFYSLHEWMDHVHGAFDMKTMQQKLSLLKDLTLDSVEGPQNTRWTTKMNVAYEQLFWVDVKNVNKMETVAWNSNNQLLLAWDVACPNEITSADDLEEGGETFSANEQEDAALQLQQLFLERNGRQPTSDEELKGFFEELMEEVVEQIKNAGAGVGAGVVVEEEEEEEDDTML